MKRKSTAPLKITVPVPWSNKPAKIHVSAIGITIIVIAAVVLIYFLCQ